MSVGKVSDDGTLSIFTKDDVLITCKGAPILIGVRDDHGRYRIPLTQHKGTWQPRKPSKRAKQVLQQANSVYDLPSTEQAIKWMHAVCGYPVKSTWLKAIKAGNFVGWPLLTEANVKKYYPETAETQKGHLNQTRKNVRSTKAKPFEEVLSNQLCGKKEKDVYVKVYDVRETVFTDQTGKFPTRSQAGNKYLMVLVDIDSSGILVEPLKNRTDPELTRAYEKLLLRLKLAGIVPKKHVLDNEVSAAMKDLITTKYHMEYELVPPGCHRRNAAEVAIRNFKVHFLSILAGVADDFPLRFWDKLLPQAEITINLLRQSNVTPTVSAYAHLNGPFDYNKMPLAPMGCNVQVHEKSDARGTWAFHSVDGWYLNTSPEQYRTHRCHIKATNSERFSDTMLNYRQLLRHPDYNADWTLSSANEFGRLANGVGGRVKGTNTITFIPKAAVPPNRRKDVTYGTFVCTREKGTQQDRFVVGGDRINYPGEVATPTADMLVAKMLFNGVVSSLGAKFMTMDITNFYLNTPLKRPEFIRLNIRDIPQEIIDEYKLKDIAERDGSIYLQANKGMYGLPHEGLIANVLLEKRLNKAGYFQSKLVPGLWSHKTRPISFTLVVDDFGVKYIGKEHALHLQSVIEQHYKCSTDWYGNRYIGITIDWDYINRKVHLSMPGYKDKALKQFQHRKATTQHSPFQCKPIKYVAKKQFAIQPSTAAPLNKADKKFIQQVCGKFLYLARAVDPTLLCPISAIASQSANPTTDTMEQTKQLLDYIATQDDAVITYSASDMVLAVHSDASYLSEPKARSRAGGHFFLSTAAEAPPTTVPF
eukprot:CCRYP_004591-RA/>CCRYP_004591-RA protein AED:0.17 eAED:0.17 QI:0/0/0/1/0/0/4/0/815